MTKSDVFNKPGNFVLATDWFNIKGGTYLSHRVLNKKHQNNIDHLNLCNTLFDCKIKTQT